MQLCKSTVLWTSGVNVPCSGNCTTTPVEVRLFLEAAATTQLCWPRNVPLSTWTNMWQWKSSLILKIYITVNSDPQDRVQPVIPLSLATTPILVMVSKSSVSSCPFSWHFLVLTWQHVAVSICWLRGRKVGSSESACIQKLCWFNSIMAYSHRSNVVKQVLEIQNKICNTNRYKAYLDQNMFCFQ